jgi:proprotein convertase subtilisin/kexin type 5
MVTDGGGWTVVANETYEAGTSWIAWDDNTVSTACESAFTRIRGGYNAWAGGTRSGTYTLMAIPHSSAKVDLDYVAIDSWDGESASVGVDGATIWTTNFNQGGMANVCGGGWGEPTQKPISPVNVVHSTNNLTLSASSTLDQAPADESFGVDNVYIMIR